MPFNLTDLDPTTRWAIVVGGAFVVYAIVQVVLEWTRPRR